MLKIGLSTNGKEINETFFKNCRDAGISCIEVSVSKSECEKLDFERLKKMSADFGIELWSFHLPFSPFTEIDISSTDEKLRLQTVSYLSELILKAGEAGIRHYVIHPSGEPIDIIDRREKIELSKKSLRELADVAEKAGGTLLIEDLPRTCLGRSSYDMLELLKADPRLRVVFDTNHLLGEYIPDFIEKVGPYIESLHVSDYDFWNERHWLCGEGKIDWQEVYRGLLRVGYRGPWLYEVEFKAPWSIKRSRDLNEKDFVRNAEEIFENRPITVLGTPIEPMTFWEE